MIARPKQNKIYLIEKERLSVQVLHALGTLKHNPDRQKLATFQSQLLQYLQGSLTRVAENAFYQAAKDVQRPIDNVRRIRLKSEIFDRADQAAKWITATTGVALDITAAMSKERALSQGRADLIGVNNLAVAFFRGTRFGWGLDANARKSWYVSDAHDNDDTCDDNEDDGPIPIDEPFQSGDFEPPAHLNCECELELHR